jgi:regulator of RNase E activity RraB
MMQDEDIEQWHQFNQETIDALIVDGSDQSKPHVIEYHFAGKDFEALEKAAVDAFKAGFEVGDADEIYLDDGGVLFCFDATASRHLELHKINADTALLLTIAKKHKVNYDGWGTYFVE